MLNEDAKVFTAQKGFIFFDESNDLCLMESISRIEPFNFTDETQIFHVSASDNKVQNRTCKWKFTAPQGFGFKVVVTWFSASSRTQTLIENTTDILAK